MEKETAEIKPEEEKSQSLTNSNGQEAEVRQEEPQQEEQQQPEEAEEEEPKPKKKSKRRRRRRKELTPEQRDVLVDAFHLFDKDGNGSIDRYELREIMRALGFNPTPDEVEQMIKEVDEDGSGKIEIDEFINMMETKLLLERDIKDEIQKAFKFFIELAQDEDQDLEEITDYSIDLKKLKKVAEVLGETNIDEELYQKMIEVGDRDKDGVVKIEEFMRIMRKMKLF